MILGIGVDIASVSRIKEKLKRNTSFKAYVFSTHEIQYCDKKANPAESYAVRFAAKEAFLKALGSGLAVNFELNQIEVSADEEGAPFFKFSSEVKATIVSKWNTEPRVMLSLSHEEDKAIAFVIIETK